MRLGTISCDFQVLRFRADKVGGDGRVARKDRLMLLGYTRFGQRWRRCCAAIDPAGVDGCAGIACRRC